MPKSAMPKSKGKPSAGEVAPYEEGQSETTTESEATSEPPAQPPKPVAPKPRGGAKAQPKSQVPAPRNPAGPIELMSPSRDDETTTSDESRETKRIRVAASSWDPRARTRDLVAGPPVATQTFARSATCPANSGLTAYAAWVLHEVLSEEERSHLLKQSFTYCECYPDMKVSSMAVAALQRAAEPLTGFSGTCVGKLTGGSKGERRAEDWPACDIAFIGATPNEAGEEDFLRYLDHLHMDERPRVILGDFAGPTRDRQRKRIADGAAGSFAERGYVGRTIATDALKFGLPASRPGLLCVFVKRSSFGPQGQTAAEETVAKIVEIANRSQIKRPENLADVLARVGGRRTFSAQPDVERVPRKDAKRPMPQRCVAYMTSHGLTDADVYGDAVEPLRELLRPNLLPAELPKVMLSIQAMRKESGEGWRDKVLVSDLSSNCFAPRESSFMEIYPNRRYLVLDRGEPRLAGDAILLSVQGVQPEEARLFALSEESPATLRKWAGMAMPPNVCCALTAAALAVAKP